MFFGTSISKAFWKDFGRVWGGFWEAEILDFRTFFVIFSKQNLECNLEAQKIEKKRRQNDLRHQFGVAAAVCAALGGRKKDGGKATWQAS